MDGLNDQLKEAQDALTKANDDLTTKTEAQEASQKEVTRLTKDLETLGGNHSDVAEALVNATAKIEKLGVYLQSAAASLADGIGMCEKPKTSKTALQAELDKVKTAIDEFEEKATGFSVRLNTNQITLDAAQSNITELEGTQRN